MQNKVLDVGPLCHMDSVSLSTYSKQEGTQIKGKTLRPHNDRIE